MLFGEFKSAQINFNFIKIRVEMYSLMLVYLEPFQK